MNKKICERCNIEYPASEEICDDCGFKLVDIQSTNQQDDDELQCPKCGKGITSEMKFCDGCGHQIKSDTQVDNGSQQSSDDSDDLNDSDDSEEEPDQQSPDSNDDHSQPTVSKLSYKIKVVEGMKVGKEFLLLRDEMLIGRMDKEESIFPDIDLENQDDGYVSRKHAIIRQRNDDVTIEDLGGVNGTMLDNKPIEANKEITVLPNQVIRVGKVGLLLLKEG